MRAGHVDTLRLLKPTRLNRTEFAHLERRVGGEPDWIKPGDRLKEITRAVVINVVATPRKGPERWLERRREKNFLHLIRFDNACEIRSWNCIAKIGPVCGGSPIFVRSGCVRVERGEPVSACLELIDSETVNIASPGEMPWKRYSAHGERSRELDGTESPLIEI
jgi:hypothetical protein